MYLLLAALFGCIDHVSQVAGTGAVYTTRCAAEMTATGPEWEARCKPPACADHFESVAVGNVVVAIDPNGKVAGYAERTCLQDLSNASALFQPVIEPAEPPPGEPTPAAAPPEPAVPGDVKPPETL